MKIAHASAMSNGIMLLIDVLTLAVSAQLLFAQQKRTVDHV